MKFKINIESVIILINMDLDHISCPKCKEAIFLNSYFCQNCGKKLRERPASTSIFKQIYIYLISFLMPPSGLWYGFSYLRQEDEKAKAVGAVAILLTLISILVSIIIVINLINTLNQVLNGGSSSSLNTTNTYLDKMLNNQIKQYKDVGL